MVGRFVRDMRRKGPPAHMERSMLFRDQGKQTMDYNIPCLELVSVCCSINTVDSLLAQASN